LTQRTQVESVVSQVGPTCK